MNNRYTQNRHEGKLLSILYGGDMKEKWKEWVKNDIWVNMRIWAYG